MGVRNSYQQAADYQNRIRSYYTPDLPYILATEVLEEIARQCRSGKQYLTFPNRISAEEKAKLEAKNYIVTENTIQSKNRDGIGDEYIGFQVALNATAASDYRPMTISEEETNGISGGGGDVPTVEANGFVVGTMALGAFGPSLHDSIVAPMKFWTISEWNWWQAADDNASTSQTVTASIKTRCILLIAVMHRSETITIDSEGWELVIKSKPATSGSSTNQWISIYQKWVDPGSYTIKVTQTSSVRMNLKLIALYNVSRVEVVEDALIPTASYTPIAKTGKKRLYFVSSITASNTSSVQTYSASNYGDLDLQSIEEQRFYVWGDYEPDINETPTFTFLLDGYVADKSNSVVLDLYY